MAPTTRLLFSRTGSSPHDDKKQERSSQAADNDSILHTGDPMFVNRKLVTVLLELHRSRRSGILRAEKGPARRQLILNCGTLVFAESNLPEEHLARIMVTMALLEKTRLKEIAGMMKEGSTSEEAILSLPGLNIAGIEKSRLEQAVLITASLLGLDCNLRFYPGENLMKSRVSLGLKLPELMLLSVRHAVKTGILKVPLEFENAMFSAAMDAQSRASDFPLDSAESQALSLVNGKTGSEELLSNIPRGTLLTLYVLGLVDFEPRISSEDESAALIQQFDEMLRRFETASLYEILSVPATAESREIQASYHERAKQLHPDRFQSDRYSPELRTKAQQVFSRINQAYLTLKNRRCEPCTTDKTRQGKDGAAAEESAEAAFREDVRHIAARLSTAVQRFRLAWLCPENASYNHYLGVAEAEFPNLRKRQKSICSSHRAGRRFGRQPPGTGKAVYQGVAAEEGRIPAAGGGTPEAGPS